MTARELQPEVPFRWACEAMGLSRPTAYRLLAPPAPAREKVLNPARRPPPRKLSDTERREVLRQLNGERFRDLSPAEVYATLLDENVYLCSLRTMYRLLANVGGTTERRRQRHRSGAVKPELLATGPNQVWSWDITKLHGPRKWTYYYLYVLLDIFSRYVVGWLVSERQSGELGKRLIMESCKKQGITGDHLTIHSDRGGPMISHSVGELLDHLGIDKSLSRPHTSDDNPYSEAQFKTVKYSPDFPERFGCIEDAVAFCRRLFAWYNDEHHHVALAYFTPADIHYGRVKELHRRRQEVLTAAYQTHPERFVRKAPVAAKPPTAAWINPPKPTTEKPSANA